MSATAAPPLDALDPLDLELELSDDERAVRDRVRAWVDERVRPRIAEDFERGHWPREHARELGELGVHLQGSSAVQYEGTSEVHTLVIGHALTGGRAFA